MSASTYNFDGLLSLLQSIQCFDSNSHPHPLPHPETGETIGYLHNDLTHYATTILQTPLQPQLEKLRKSLPQLHKVWRGEQYPLFAPSGKLFDQYERGAHGLLGTRCYGIHINGIVLHPEQVPNPDNSNDSINPQNPRKPKIKALWLQRRSATKKTNPLKLDTIVGGGISYDSDPVITMIKEAAEEASIPNHMICADTATAVGVVHLNNQDTTGNVNISTEYIWDMLLPESFCPKPGDGEVEEFMLVSIEDVSLILNMQVLATDKYLQTIKYLLNDAFAPQPTLVIIDLLVRHGIIDASNCSDYSAIVQLLRPEMTLPGPPNSWEKVLPSRPLYQVCTIR